MRGIYAIRHAKTGRVYIGKSNGVNARWRQHRHDLDRGRHINAGLQADWAKYGPDAFTFEVLEEVGAEVDLRDAEQRHFAAAPPDRRYNIAGVNPATPAGELPSDAVGEFFALLADIVSGRWQWEREHGPAALRTLRSMDERLSAVEMRALGEAAPSTGSVLFDLIMEKGADNAMLAHVGQSLERRIGRLEEHVFETDVEL